MSQENNNPFANRPKTQTRLQGLTKNGFVIVVTRAYGPTGEDLIDYEGPEFSGEPGVKVRVKQGALEDDVVLSPFYGDPSKKFSTPFKEGVKCELFCAKSGVPLDKIPGMKSDKGGEYYAVYMTPKLKNGEFLAINDIWGDTSSRVLSEDEWLALMAETEDQALEPETVS